MRSNRAARSACAFMYGAVLARNARSRTPRSGSFRNGASCGRGNSFGLPTGAVMPPVMRWYAGRLLLELAHDRHVRIAEDLDGCAEAPQRGLQRRRGVARRHQPLLQRDAPFLRLREDLHREAEMVRLRFLVPGIDRVADHRPAGGLGEHRLEARPVGEPLLHPVVIQLPRREGIEVRADVTPGSLRQGLGRGG